MMPARRPRRIRRSGFVGAVCAAGLLLAILPSANAAVLERSLSYAGLEITTDETGRWNGVTLPGGMPDVLPGEPEIPSCEVMLRLPAGTSVGRVTCETLEERLVSLGKPVRPYPGEPSTIDPYPPPPIPDSLIYGADLFFPRERFRLASEFELSSGGRYAAIRVYPVRYQPQRGELSWVVRALLRVELVEGPAAIEGLARKRPSLKGAGALAAPAEAWREIRFDEPGFAPYRAPSTDGTAVEYVILVPADDGLEAAWQPLADWKTACGHPARVIRTDWIDAQYPNGADAAERVRLFLQDAYVNWGLRWALMGADVEGVPVRHGFSTLLGGTNIATDYYYACLERNWDADGDGVFGEAYTTSGDSSDTTPEIQVGRVSARTPQDVAAYLEKYFRYARDPDRGGYLDRILLLGEVLFHVQWTLHGRSGEPDCYHEECNDTGGCRTDSDGYRICSDSDGAEDCIELLDIVRDTLGLPHEVKLLLERHEWYSENRPDLLSVMA
ncbi:MAG: C25 family cysteine peptidase, partial [Candidatus Eisenbacteria bacterium]